MNGWLGWGSVLDFFDYGVVEGLEEGGGEGG